MIYENGIEMVHEDFGRGWAVRFIGSEGILIQARKKIDSKPEGIATSEIKITEKRLYFSDNHYQDWIDAIKKRTQPIADVETWPRSFIRLQPCQYCLSPEQGTQVGSGE